MFKRIFSILILFLSGMFIFTSNWILKTFGNVTVEEIVFTLLISQKGADIAYVYNFILNVLLYTLIFTIILYCLFVQENRFMDIFIKNLKLKSIVRVILIFLIFLLSVLYSFNKLDLFEYIRDQFTFSTLIEEEYVDTSEVNISFGSKKRNLIYIFLESMESSYTSVDNGGILEENLIAELDLLAEDNVSFSHTDKLGGAQSVPGTTWTTGAMVAQTSGLPLKLGFNNNSYNKYKTFLPYVYTLGDILKDNGYNQMVMFGSDAEFGGRDKYFTSHGNYVIYDFYDAVNDGRMREEDKVWWGFDDHALFKYAKEEIIELSKLEEPFNFTLLTADTHFEDGYLSDECKANYDDQYSNVIACSSEMVYEFVKWIQEQDFYENTTIVIVGDHLTMDVDYFEDIDTSYTRTTYNVFINSVVSSENTNNRIFTTMDLFPSTLAAMGVSIEGDRLGLGTNLFSDKETLAEEYGIDVLRDELAMTSTFYNDMVMYGKSS